MNNKYLKALAMVFAMLASQLVWAQCSIPITYIQETTCQGTPYNFNGTNLDSAGTYNDTLQGTGGCDSIIQLQLFLIPIVYTNVYDTVCQGQSFVWNANGLTYTNAGTYGDTLFQAVTFCDSVLLLHLATRPSNNDTFVINATYCTPAGGPGGGGGPTGYDFFGTRETASGTYVYHGGALPSGGICADSVVLLHLKVGAAPVTIGGGGGAFGGGGAPDTIRTCGSSYDLYGTTLTTGGNYTDTVISSLGCDSIIANVYLILNSGYNSAAVAGVSCGGAPFVFRGVSYPGPAGGGGGGGGRPVVYYDTVPGPGGCDTIYTITVSAGRAPRAVNYTASFCQGSSFTYDGFTFTTAGIDTLSVPNAGGCDSTVIFTLSYLAAPTSLSIDSFCDGSSYIFRGHTYTDSGLHIFTVPAPGGGCDSVIEIYLSYKSAPVINVSASFCQGTSFTYRDSVFTTDGTHGVIVAAPSGCDTIINVTLTYTTPPSLTLVDSICPGASFTYDGNTFTTAGTHTFTTSHPGICDSLITINLTLLRAPRAFYRDSFCAGTTYTYDGNSYTAAGTYTLTVPAPTGCDSAITLILTNKVSPATPVITQTGDILIVNPTATTYQWYLNGTAITGATSQAYTATQSGVYYVMTTGTGSCPGISANDTVSGVGVTEVSAADMFKLYPNPNNGKFTIETTQYSGTTITIYDVLGREVYQKQLSSAVESIDMSSTLNGTYYLVMKNQQFTRFAHFVIAQ